MLRFLRRKGSVVAVTMENLGIALSDVARLEKELDSQKSLVSEFSGKYVDACTELSKLKAENLRLQEEAASLTKKARQNDALDTLLKIDSLSVLLGVKQGFGWQSIAIDLGSQIDTLKARIATLETENAELRKRVKPDFGYYLDTVISSRMADAPEPIYVADFEKWQRIKKENKELRREVNRLTGALSGIHWRDIDTLPHPEAVKDTFPLVVVYRGDSYLHPSLNSQVIYDSFGFTDLRGRIHRLDEMTSRNHDFFWAPLSEIKATI